MFTLFLRTLIVYALVFAVLRLMGKRQISDMQPFDLVITLLIADVASVPISDSAIPLLYGIVPILALFILHRLVAHASLKSEKLRGFVCGRPLVIIADGVVQEDAMRAANYTLGDLLEQLRAKDVFAVSQVRYGILETNGSLSVLEKAAKPNEPPPRPSVLLVSDGAIEKKALSDAGHDGNWLKEKLGAVEAGNCLFVFLDPDGRLHVQEKQKRGTPPAVRFIGAKK
ncbi:MAG: DUF421 domain-containing protein [Clostridia bacterium]|nr:DUF421 domain-containing protein [Clostridia bacterium]